MIAVTLKEDEDEDKINNECYLDVGLKKELTGFEASEVFLASFASLSDLISFLAGLLAGVDDFLGAVTKHTGMVMLTLQDIHVQKLKIKKVTQATFTSRLLHLLHQKKLFEGKFVLLYNIFYSSTDLPPFYLQVSHRRTKKQQDYIK
jgi:hypothetical protein